MKINMDLSCLEEKCQFDDESVGGILYLPFQVSIEGQCYPAKDWEDYPIVNLLAWADQILSHREDFSLQVFEFMDDAWEMRWRDCDLESEVGTLYMIHRGLEVVLWSVENVALRDVAKETLSAIRLLVNALEQFVSIENREPKESIAKLVSAANDLNQWIAGKQGADMRT